VRRLICASRPAQRAELQLLARAASGLPVAAITRLGAVITGRLAFPRQIIQPGTTSDWLAHARVLSQAGTAVGDRECTAK